MGKRGVKYKLIPNVVMTVFLDWQECLQPEGEVELIKFDKHFGYFTGQKGLTYVGERWKVRFLNSNFVTHRYIRVKRYKIKD
jgi:hypothetical protein